MEGADWDAAKGEPEIDIRSIVVIVRRRDSGRGGEGDDGSGAVKWEGSRDGEAGGRGQGFARRSSDLIGLNLLIERH